MKGEIFYGNINGYRGIITQLGEGEQELGKLGVDDSRECFVGCCCLLERDFMAVNAGLPIGGNVSVFPQLVV